MIINPLLLEPRIIDRIRNDRTLLAAKGQEPDKAALSTEGRKLGLAHEIFTLNLDALGKSGPASLPTPQPGGVRVLELQGQQPVAFYDLASRESGAVSQMSATSPYLPLFAQALEKAAATSGGEQRFDLRLLRVPALNFEALWLHAGKEDEDQVIPLRGFHGFTPMQPVPYREALERLRQPAQQALQQDDRMGG